LKTSKPFSTITYNTNGFLTVKLDDLVRRRKIAFWAFIEHLPEEDEKKAHKHLYIVPNGQINTDEVGDYLLEHDPEHPDKPLKCMPFNSSKFADWYLYVLHDTAYLASKGQSRKYHYTRDEIVCSDTDFLNEEIHRIDLSKFSKMNALRDAVENGIPFEKLVLNGQIPIHQIFAYQRTYEILNYHSTFRNDRQAHTPVDPETGEVKNKDCQNRIPLTPIEDEDEIQFINEIFKEREKK
jgi:hypothetical protein